MAPYRKDMSDKEKAKLYNRRLFIANEEFKGWENDAREWWSRYENGAKRSQNTPKGHRVNTPLGTSTIDSLFASLTAVDVEFLINHMGDASDEQAEVATLALNKEWQLVNGPRETDFVVKDSLVTGIGWAKVAYEYESVDKEFARETDQIRSDITQLIQEAQDAGTAAPTPDQIANLVPLTESGEEVLIDRVVYDYVPWDLVRIDPNAKLVKDITWVAQLTKVRVDEVKANPTYREYVKLRRGNGGLRALDELKGASTFEDTVLPQGKAESDEMFVVVCEMWDLQSGTVCTFVDGKDWLLFETVNPLALELDYKNRSPFVPLVLRKTNTRVRGLGDMELMKPSLDEQNIYRSRTATYLERFVPKVMGPEDALTPEGKKALSSSEYGAYVAVAREYAQDSSLITPLQPPELPAEIFGMDARIEDSVREATGMNELMRGLFPDRKRTATETAEVVSAGAARQAEKRNTLEEFYHQVGLRILKLMQMNYDQPRIVQYVDPVYGQVEWEFTGDDIRFEYAMDVALTPKEANDRKSRRDDALALFNMLVPVAQPGPDGSSTVDMAGLITWFVGEYGIPKKVAMQILNTPEEQQAQQLAAQQATAGMASAANGAPNPGMTTGPLDADQVSALTNQGAVPPETAAAAVGGIGPGIEGAIEQVSESAGARST